MLLRESASQLSDTQLLELLFDEAGKARAGRVAARKLLAESSGGNDAEGLQALRKLSVGALTKLRGLSPARARRIAVAFELGRRVEVRRQTPRLGVPLGVEQVHEWTRPRLCGLDHEEVWVLCVNAQGQLTSTWQVGKGGIFGCGLLPRDILAPVMRDAASGFVLVHNHPSGDPTPSHEDIELTHQLARAAETLCVPLLDHVIVANGGAVSLFERGLLTAGTCSVQLASAAKREPAAEHSTQ